MKKKEWLLFLVLILCFSFFSCKENTRVAVLTFDKGPDVPDDIASLARNIAVERILKKKKIDVISTNLIDQKMSESGVATMSEFITSGISWGADVIVVGNIAVEKKDQKADRFIDNLRGNPVRYTVEVTCINVWEDTVIASFTNTYDAKLKKLDRDIKKLKLR